MAEPIDPNALLKGAFTDDRPITPKKPPVPAQPLTPEQQALKDSLAGALTDLGVGVAPPPKPTLRDAAGDILTLIGEGHIAQSEARIGRTVARPDDVPAGDIHDPSQPREPRAQSITEFDPSLLNQEDRAANLAFLAKHGLTLKGIDAKGVDTVETDSLRVRIASGDVLLKDRIEMFPLPDGSTMMYVYGQSADQDIVRILPPGLSDDEKVKLADAEAKAADIAERQVSVAEGRLQLEMDTLAQANTNLENQLAEQTRQFDIITAAKEDETFALMSAGLNPETRVVGAANLTRSIQGLSGIQNLNSFLDGSGDADVQAAADTLAEFNTLLGGETPGGLGGVGRSTSAGRQAEALGLTPRELIAAAATNVIPGVEADDTLAKLFGTDVGGAISLDAELSFLPDPAILGLNPQEAQILEGMLRATGFNTEVIRARNLTGSETARNRGPRVSVGRRGVA